MKLLVACGGREYENRACVAFWLARARAAGFGRLAVGDARGADRLCAEEGRRLGFSVVVLFADWRGLGWGAGFIRNQALVDLRPDACLAFPGGRGTADTVRRCRAAGIPVRVAATQPPLPQPEPAAVLENRTYYHTTTLCGRTFRQRCAKEDCHYA